jgi:CCR4-NOT transcription complex subunit 4
MDISDLNFKPCICGYQVDRPAYHIIYIMIAYLFPRFVAFAGIISKRTSTNVVLPVDESILMMLSNSNPSLPKSEFLTYFTFKILLNILFLSGEDSHKRLTQQKKQRERERKELDALGRRPLANVRVVQRNVVYVVGIGPRFAKEEVCYRCWSRTRT